MAAKLLVTGVAALATIGATATSITPTSRASTGQTGNQAQSITRTPYPQSPADQPTGDDDPAENHATEEQFKYVDGSSSEVHDPSNPGGENSNSGDENNGGDAVHPYNNQPRDEFSAKLEAQLYLLSLRSEKCSEDVPVSEAEVDGLDLDGPWTFEGHDAPRERKGKAEETGIDNSSNRQ